MPRDTASEIQAAKDRIEKTLGRIDIQGEWFRLKCCLSIDGTALRTDQGAICASGGTTSRQGWGYRAEVSGNRGRPYGDLDGILNGIWWILCTGSMWNQMPAKYGKWNSVWRTFRRWCESGMWEWLLERTSTQCERHDIAVMLDATHIKVHQDATRHPMSPHQQRLGKTKGGRNTKLSLLVNLPGLPLSMKLVCGNQHDSKSAIDTLHGFVEGHFVLADKAYDTNAIRQYIETCGGFAVIPNMPQRIKPFDYDKQIGKLRHKVENTFAKLKRFRRIATRYDKLPKTLMGFLTLDAITLWHNFHFVHTA